MNTMEEIKVVLDSVMVQSEGRLLLNDICFSIRRGEILALTGPSGSGKTLLGKVVAGLVLPTSGHIDFKLKTDAKSLFIPQQHDFRYLLPGRSYYQQRFDNNYGNEIPKVEEILAHVAKENNRKAEDLNFAEEALRITELRNRRLIELSNGEGKRLQVAIALLNSPEILVFDNPFIGLDPFTREVLNNLFHRLNSEGKLVVIITSSQYIPSSVTKCIYLSDGEIQQIVSPEEIKRKDQQPDFPVNLPDYLKIPGKEQFENAIELRNVHVSIGGKKILSDISWTVRKGERWALTGHNGAGKSTLLSLITADNPQSYQNEIYLFDKKRGSGESIWDIKRKIGYISPELHLYFQRSPNYTEAISISSGKKDLSGYSAPVISCFEAVASGFGDQIGSSGKISTVQEKQINCWLDLLGISNVGRKSLYALPLGEQRLVLLARAMVKNPPLLILDEPCQGLDEDQIYRFKKVVDAICIGLNKTLIYVSHYDEDIPGCVDKVLKLENGSVVRCEF